MKKKMISMGLVLSLFAVAIIGGTLAYFTDEKGPEENIFTVGNVSIDLTEPKWDKEADHHLLPSVEFEKDPTITMISKGYKNAAGEVATVNTDDAYVFMDVELNKYASFMKLMGLNEGWAEDKVWENWQTAIADKSYTEILDKWFVGIEHTDWQVMNYSDLLAELNKMAGGTNPEWLTIQLGYKGNSQEPLSFGDSVTLFTSVKMPETVTSQMMEQSKFNTDFADWKMKFTAKAIQAEGFDDFTAAYGALYN